MDVDLERRRLLLAGRAHRPDAAKHKGISIIIVPMDTPGITLSPLRLLGDHDINAVYFDDVRVPVANCVGGENNGWKLITNQLNHERVTLCSTGMIENAYLDVLAWSRTARRPDGSTGDRRTVGAAEPRPRARRGRRAPA